ncbi:MAG: diadenylate cyclase CdaA [Eubacterium sp.]|nr:diadenylate cyclase CdaA [Eubacterium sp.]
MQVHVLPYLIPPKQIEVIDIIQVALIAFFVYNLILWVKDTRAYTLLRGILFIIAFMLVANILGMEVIVWLVGRVGIAAFTAIVIIFQPELRKALEQFGHRSFFARLLPARSGEENKRFSDQTLNEIVHASYEMGEVRTGALIIVEQNIRLSDYEQTGIPVDGIVSNQLLINIFEHNTPLHDGAVIVRGDRVMAATCYLPLSDNTSLSKRLGTRHRAGVGISEVSDCFAIIVSEETGHVSYAMGGRLYTAASPAQLREALHEIQKLAQVNWKRRGKEGANA